MKDEAPTYGYCHIIIEPYVSQKLLSSNGERAFIIAQLQDLLSPRLILGDIPAHRQLASCIDLLAFSISSKAIHLLVFTIDFMIAKDFAHRLSARFSQYQSDLSPSGHMRSSEARVSLETLTGPYQALSHSIAIHLLHEDWEYDRYSSIGFYLHDRRGDWMRIWRLAHLYEGESELYYELIQSYRLKQTDNVNFAFTPPFASLPLPAS